MDKNGLISKEEFMNLILRKMPHKEHSLSNNRAQRNLKQFVEFMKWSSVSAETIISLVDSNKDHSLDLKEFEILLNERVSFKISKEETL